MLDWLFYLLFGFVSPNCQADTSQEVMSCEAQIQVYTGGGGVDPDDDNGSSN